MTAFSDILAGLHPTDDGFAVTIPAGWLQGRTTFGGLVAALALTAAARASQDLPPLRAAQFAFVGPASDRLVLTSTTLRQGRSVSFVSVDGTSEAGLAVRALLCFGGARDSALAFGELPAPAVPPPSECPPLLPDGAPRPAFAGNFDIRLAGGSALLSGGAPDLIVWSRHRDEAAPDKLAALIAIADALPSSAVCMTHTIPRQSTMTWSIEVAPNAASQPQSWRLVRRAADIIGQGYVAETVTVWSEDGTPLLTGRQSLAVFD